MCSIEIIEESMKRIGWLLGVAVLTGGVLFSQTQTSDQNAKKSQQGTKNTQGIVGKQTATGQPSRTVTTTKTAGQTTAGAETETGVRQSPGQAPDVTNTGAANPTHRNPQTALPPNPSDPGQTEQEADLNAQAASRAELAPGTTLGVNGQTNQSPTQGTSASAEARSLPSTTSGESQAATPKTGRTGAQKSTPKKQ
jgi:hypothetical protein